MNLSYTDVYNESIQWNKDEALHVELLPYSHGSLFIEITSQSSGLDLDIEIHEYANSKLFIYNHSHQPACFNLNMNIYRDASCQMGFLDLQEGMMKWKQQINLLESGANFEILSGQLCHENSEKVCSMEIKHLADHTQGLMKNFAVLFDKGKYEMVANGNISKGCYEAQSHQATRVLTLGKGHIAKVIPLLLIDENDVKASHALTIGQPDADQLYYLQSRGLSNRQALGLLSIGYFLPVIAMIEDESLRDTMRQEVESQVGLHGN